MKILFLSNLFPDTTERNRGSDNAVLLKALSPACEIRVLCPRPALFPGGGKFTACLGDEIFLPIYRTVGYVPKMGSLFNHRLMASGIREDLAVIRKDFPFDVALTSWIYPDACATALLAAERKFPFVAIAQGSDVHQYLKMPRRRKIIQKAMGQAAAVITRSGELARLLGEAGVEESKLNVIYNGIDPAIFCRGDRAAARQKLNLPQDSAIVLFVGNFLPIKNPLLLVRAFAEVCRRQPEKKPLLVMLGSGPMEPDIKNEAAAAGCADRVILAGRKSLPEVAQYMQAANVLGLSSDNEGFPNVILEAWACGLPVVSTRVGGIGELLREDYLGQLVEQGKVEGLVEGLVKVLGRATEAEKIAQFGSQFSWERTAKGYLEVLRAVMA